MVCNGVKNGVQSLILSDSYLLSVIPTHGITTRVETGFRLNPIKFTDQWRLDIARKKKRKTI